MFFILYLHNFGGKMQKTLVALGIILTCTFYS